MSSINFPGITFGTVPVRVKTADGTSLRAIPTMVLSTLFLLTVVTFVPWAVPLFMPRVI